MAEVLEMPRMSDTMEEGNIVGWLKKVGDEVEAGETIAEVETDKATMELDSPFDGVILHIAVEEGSVDIGGVIAVIGEEGEDWEAAIAELQGGSNGSSQNGSAPESTDEPAAAPVDYGSQNPEQSPGGNSDPSSGDDRVKASPLARSMAKQAGLNLSDISGTGDNGRIVKRDVEKAMEAGSQPAPSAAPQPQPAAPASAPTPPAATPQPVAAKEQAMPSVVPFTFNGGDENYQDQTVSNMRKTIARRLGESKFGAPHFYLTIEIDMENVMKLRKRLNEVSPVKLSFNDLVVKAAAAALREHPVINSSWLGDKIRVNGNINIGVAVAVAARLLAEEPDAARRFLGGNHSVVRHLQVDRLPERRIDAPQIHIGNAHLRSLQFLPNAFGHAVDAVFAGGVGRRARHRRFAQHPGNVDDQAAFGLLHGRHKIFHQIKRAV